MRTKGDQVGEHGGLALPNSAQQNNSTALQRVLDDNAEELLWAAEVMAGSKLAGEVQQAHMSLYDWSREEDLVAAAQAGMSNAMDELFVRHKTALYRAARRFTRSHEEAEDLVQDAMLRAFVNVRKFRKESHFGTWLNAIVTNAALSMKRKAKNTHFISIENSRPQAAGPISWDIPDVRRSPEEEIMQQELVAFLHRVLRRQSRRHQIILERCVFDEVRIAEAASSLGLTIDSAKSSLYRARRRVLESFERRGFVKRRKLQTMQAR